MVRLWGVLLQVVLIGLGSASILVFARDGFHVFMHETLAWLVILVESVMSAILESAPIKRILAAVLGAVQEFLAQFGIKISAILQPHWKQAFVLMSLGLGGYAQARSNWSAAPVLSAIRISLALVFALAAGVMAGTVHLAHPGVLLWPLIGGMLFLVSEFIIGALAAPQRAIGRGIFIIGAILLVWLGIFALSADPTAVLGSAWAPSFGLYILAALVFSAALVALIRGIGPKDGSHGAGLGGWLANPGRRFGLRVLSTVGAAALIAAVGQWALSAFSGGFGSAPTAPGETFQDCEDCPAMVVIPGGAFTMGTSEADFADLRALGLNKDDWADEQPDRRVRVEQFAMAKTEVTVEQFRSFTDETGYRPSGICFGVEGAEFILRPTGNWQDPGFRQGANDPVVCVTWWDAQAYARWLSLKTGASYRLPSEAEWEYAARAGSSAISPWELELARACSPANSFDLAGAEEFEYSGDRAFPCNDEHVFTAPAGSFEPNAFGLYDMYGNVWEWTQDCYEPSYEGAPPDQRAVQAPGCGWRVLRGGSWGSNPLFLRSAYRSGNYPAGRNSDVGFRIARTLEP